MDRQAYSYMIGQFELAQGEIEHDLFPRDAAAAAAIHQLFVANNDLPFERHERETKDEMYARWGIK